MSIYTYEVHDIDAVITFPPGSDHLFVARPRDGILFLTAADGSTELDNDLGAPHWERTADGGYTTNAEWNGVECTHIFVGAKNSIVARVEALGGTVDY